MIVLTCVLLLTRLLWKARSVVLSNDTILLPTAHRRPALRGCDSRLVRLKGHERTQHLAVGRHIINAHGAVVASGSQPLSVRTDADGLDPVELIVQVLDGVERHCVAKPDRAV